MMILRSSLFLCLIYLFLLMVFSFIPPIAQFRNDFLFRGTGTKKRCEYDDLCADEDDDDEHGASAEELLAVWCELFGWLDFY